MQVGAAALGVRTPFRLACGLAAWREPKLLMGLGTHGHDELARAVGDVASDPYHVAQVTMCALIEGAEEADPQLHRDNDAAPTDSVASISAHLEPSLSV